MGFGSEAQRSIVDHVAEISLVSYNSTGESELSIYQPSFATP